MIAQWPSEKFEKLAPYMRQEMKDVDFQYILDRREAISAYDNTIYFNQTITYRLGAFGLRGFFCVYCTVSFW